MHVNFTQYRGLTAQVFAPTSPAEERTRRLIQGWSSGVSIYSVQSNSVAKPWRPTCRISLACRDPGMPLAHLSSKSFASIFLQMASPIRLSFLSTTAADGVQFTQSITKQLNERQCAGN